MNYLQDLLSEVFGPGSSTMARQQSASPQRARNVDVLRSELAARPYRSNDTGGGTPPPVNIGDILQNEVTTNPAPQSPQPNPTSGGVGGHGVGQLTPEQKAYFAQVFRNPNHYLFNADITPGSAYYGWVV